MCIVPEHSSIKNEAYLVLQRRLERLAEIARHNTLINDWPLTYCMMERIAFIVNDLDEQDDNVWFKLGKEILSSTVDRDGYPIMVLEKTKMQFLQKLSRQGRNRLARTCYCHLERIHINGQFSMIFECMEERSKIERKKPNALIGLPLQSDPPTAYEIASITSYLSRQPVHVQISDKNRLLINKILDLSKFSKEEGAIKEATPIERDALSSQDEFDLHDLTSVHRKYIIRSSLILLEEQADVINNIFDEQSVLLQILLNN